MPAFVQNHISICPSQLNPLRLKSTAVLFNGSKDLFNIVQQRNLKGPKDLSKYKEFKVDCFFYRSVTVQQQDHMNAAGIAGWI